MAMAAGVADRLPEASRTLLVVLTFGVAVLVANLYYAQPLIAFIGAELRISSGLAGSIVSVAQIGYGTGLFLLVPVADLVENKRLVLTMMGLTAACLAALALSGSAWSFFAASFLIGLCATAAQILLPFAAHLILEERRGRVVGNIMARVLAGIMLARPVALFVSGLFGWRAVFWGFAGLVAALALPPPRMPALCWRSAYAALMFAAFNMFWTAAPLMLADRFGLDQHQVGLFALAGAGGALAALLAGRLADRDKESEATAGSMLVLALCFAGTGWAVAAYALVPLAALTVLLDASVQTSQVVSRRTVFGTPPAIRARVNALYMTSTFVGGALGSLLGTVTFHGGGWRATAGTGGAIGAVLLFLFALERRTGQAG